MKYFSMFSGIGGFELGIQRAFDKQSAKIEQNGQGRNGDIDQVELYVLSTGRPSTLCIGFSEVNKYAIQCYEQHFKGHKNYGDATRIIPEEIPDIDFLCGGFPCQAFSIAGKRGGFDDTSGTLFFEIARILKVKRPRMFLLENVKGLLSHDNGRTFKTIITTLVELGYGVEWQVLNSKDFGVPQNRERVFIVGHLGGIGSGKVFPITGISQSNNGQDCSTAIDASYFKGIDNHDQRTAIAETQKLPDSQRIREIDGLSVTLKGEGGGQGAKTGLYAVPVLTPDRPEKRQKGRRMKEDGDPSFTLTSQDKHGVFDGMRVRRLTLTECERLQGFPDGWTSMLSDSQRYKCLGNAVTVNVIEAIVERILSEQKL